MIIAENSCFDRFLFCFQDVFSHRLSNINYLYIKIEQESGSTIFCFSNNFPSFLPKLFHLVFLIPASMMANIFP